MLLLQSDRVDVNQATDEGMTPLYIACDKNRTEIVRLLLDTNRVKVNQATEKHTTPLCIASWAGNLEIVRLLLLQPNIDIDVQDDFGDTAMSAHKGKHAFKLPQGWTTEIRTGNGPTDDGGKYKHYISPEGEVFSSVPAST